MYYDLADYLENEDVGKAPVCIPEVVTKADSMERMQEFLDATVGNAAGKKKVLLHPGTSRLAIEKGIIKTWPVADWIGLIKLMQSRSDMVPILAGGPDDKEIIAEIEKGMPLGTALVSSAGKTKSLADLAALTKLCDLIVCVDSAPMHVAVGLGTPVVAMFAVTDENKLLPKDPKFKALRSTNGTQGSGSASGVVLSPDQVFIAALEQLQLS
jgi:ADP-heptose:LPS heptosyltransferase